MGLTPPCACQRCRHHGAAIHRKRYEGHPWPDFEAGLAKSWHAYHPHLVCMLSSLPRHAVFQTFTAEETPVLRALRDWSDKIGDFEDLEDSNIAVVAGPPGTGKTLAAAWLAAHRCADEDAIWISAMALARLPRCGEERERVLDAGVLFIDDLGVERADEKFTADLDELVDRFYQGYAELIITTNCTAAQFRKRYGMRVVDRLAERGTWIPATGKSMRGGK